MGCASNFTVLTTLGAIRDALVEAHLVEMKGRQIFGQIVLDIVMRSEPYATLIHIIAYKTPIYVLSKSTLMLISKFFKIVHYD